MLAVKASDALKAVGFFHACTSMKSEATYYRLEGRHGLLRIATHQSKREPIGMEHVCATITFSGGKRDRGTLVCDEMRFNNMIWTAVGQYIMRSANPHETRYQGKRGTGGGTNLRSAMIVTDGFKPISSAPRDGTYVRLRFRPGIGRDGLEAIGQWQPHDEMPAGGSWFDRDGCYITPGPTCWAPEIGSFQ